MATQGQLERAARTKEMIRLREKGLSLESIGRRLPRNGRPISRQAVDQILQRARSHGSDVPVVRGRSDDRVNRLSARSNRRSDEAKHLFLVEGLRVCEIAAELGISRNSVHGYLRGMPDYRERVLAILRRPLRARLSYTEIRSLRTAGVDVPTIAARAGVSPDRVYQVLREGGDYHPTARVAQRIAETTRLRQVGLRPGQIAEHLSCSTATVARYRQLAQV